MPSFSRQNRNGNEVMPLSLSALVVLVCSIANDVEQHWNKVKVAIEIESAGGRVLYSYQCLDDGSPKWNGPVLFLRPVPLSQKLGPAYLPFIRLFHADIVNIKIPSSMKLDMPLIRLLNGCDVLKCLDLRGTNVDDCLLLELRECKTLRFVDLQRTDATLEGFEALKRHLPELETEYIGNDTYSTLLQERNIRQQRTEDIRRDSNGDPIDPFSDDG